MDFLWDIADEIRRTGSYNAPRYDKETLALKRAEILQNVITSPYVPLTDETKTVFAHEILRLTTGHEYLEMLPVSNDEWFSASDIGEKLGISANKVGRIANKYNIKAPQGQSNQFGRWICSKSRFSDKEVPQFIYNSDALDWFFNFLETENSKGCD